jgi:GTP-binding protein HflX
MKKNNNKVRKRAVLIVLVKKNQDKLKIKEYFSELHFLSSNLEIDIISNFTQKFCFFNKKIPLGKGKLFNLKSFIILNNINIVIFNNNLYFSQIKNLEFFLKCNIIDRSLLILNIFSIRSNTIQSKIQIKLAKYKYLLSRLTNMWSHLSNQKGGIGMKGPGESELETDRRIIKKKIFFLKKKLNSIKKQNYIKSKLRSNLINISIIGYTNSGKSTLINKIANVNLYSENKFFSTVDSVVRKVIIKSIFFLISDTVGFIRQLPHSLIECFKSTLHEVQNANILIHLVDISYKYIQEHIKIVETTLKNINSYFISRILIFNKLDKINKTNLENQLINFNSTNKFNFLYNFKKNYKIYNNYPMIFVSLKKNNLKNLNYLLYNAMLKNIINIF